MKPGVLTADAQATLLLCSHMAMLRGPAAVKLLPLTPGEWNDLAQVLIAQRLRPEALLMMDSSALQKRLHLSAKQAERVEQLLRRGAQLAVEVERMAGVGIWALTRSDEAYPGMLKERLGTLAPPVLFGAGDPTVLNAGFLAVVGSRDVDEAGERFASEIGATCASSGLALVSGGARGVDRMSMGACLRAGGRAIGVLADSLERVIREPDLRTAVAAGRLVLVSAVHPRAPFSVANAMTRNKYIYCLARYGLVVAASVEKGGTRAGALEVLKHRWVPLFVRSGEGAPPGNLALIGQGALPFPAIVPQANLPEWLAEHAASWAGPQVPRRKALVGQSSADEDDLFTVVWPHIEARLGKWPALEELARHLCVDLGQLELWVDRAVRQGLVKADATGKRAVGGAPRGEQVRFEV